MSCYSSDFDLESIAPNVDLVLFSNVLPAYSSNKSITANYTLGDAVTHSTWDWVGLFNKNWKDLGQYIDYQWTSVVSFDCNSPAKRSVLFTADKHKLTPDPFSQYQLLYISQGNHVIGVSPAFRVLKEEDEDSLNFDILFSQPTVNAADELGLCDTFELVNEISEGLQKVRPRKKRVLTVSRDHHSLLDFPSTSSSSAWEECLRISGTHPVVKEYLDNKTLAVVPYTRNMPVYDVHWKKKMAKSALKSKKSKCHVQALSALAKQKFEGSQEIEYPTKLPLMPGPNSFLQALQCTQNACSSCQIGKMIVNDFVQREEKKDERLAEVEAELKLFKTQSKEQRVQTELSASMMDWYVEQIQEENQSLQVRVDSLEIALAQERSRNLRDQEILQLPKPDSEGWVTKEPKRIERLQKTVCKNSRAVFYLRETVDTKSVQVNLLQEENEQLRQQLQVEKKSHMQCSSDLADLNVRMKVLLRERSKLMANEWNLFAKPVQETKDKKPSKPAESPVPEKSPAPEPSPAESSDAEKSPKEPSGTEKNASGSSGPSGPSRTYRYSRGGKARNKQITKLQGSERPHKPKLHKEKSQEEKCDTCGLKFSNKADRRAIEEHRTFHYRFKS